MNIIQMSLSAALIITVAALIRAAAIHRLPKKTFMILWTAALCRLLIPFDFPAKFSAFTFLENWGNQIQKGIPLSENLMNTQDLQLGHTAGYSPILSAPQTADDAISASISALPPLPPLSPLVLLWLAGILLTSGFFAIMYFKFRKKFMTSLPAESGYISSWRLAHRLKRPVDVRVSDRISAPLTYGIFKPVILLPKNMDLTDEKGISYILMHEFAHIRHFDALTKLAAAVALCLHWFNPLVWLMYILLSRDIEISCDETVVRESGMARKSAYALMLLGMEEKKNSFLPLYNGFSKYAIEERINAIMKIKKISIAATLFAIALSAGTIMIFATSCADSAANITDVSAQVTGANIAADSEEETSKDQTAKQQESTDIEIEIPEKETTEDIAAEFATQKPDRDNTRLAVYPAYDVEIENSAEFLSSAEGVTNALMPIDLTFTKSEVPIIEDLNNSDYRAVYLDRTMCLRVKKDGVIQVSRDNGKTWNVCNSDAVGAPDFVEWLAKYDPIPDGSSRRAMLKQLENNAEVRHIVFSEGKEMYFIIGDDGVQIELVQTGKAASVLIDAQRLMITSVRTQPFLVSENLLRSFYDLLVSGNILTKTVAEDDYSARLQWLKEQGGIYQMYTVTIETGGDAFSTGL